VPVDTGEDEMVEQAAEEAVEEEAAEEAAEEAEEPAEEAPAEEGAVGTAENPLVMSFVPSGETEAIITGGETIGQMLAEETGLVVETNVATSYAAVIEAMGAGNTHVAWLNTFSYMLANERFGVQPLLVVGRFGTTTYAGQIITRADSGIETLDDLVGTTFCRPDPLSTSGWIIPSLTMKAAGVDETDLGEIIDANGHDGVVTAVYNGDCDAGAVYVDARGAVEEDYPDVKDVIVVIDTSADIPNDNVSVIADLPAEIVAAIRDGLLTIADTEPGLEALDTVYNVEELETVDDAFYDDFRATLDAAGVNVSELAGE
jgi:phosphonate transport system substrate-binding protein